MTGIPPRNLSEYRPQLRPVAAPTDPFVAPGVQGPSLVDYSKLSSISPTLAGMFNNMKRQADQAAAEAAPSNKQNIYNLTAEQASSALLDPDSDEVAAFMKSAGVEYWHNPVARERTLRSVAQRVFNDTGILSKLKSTESQEAIARAIMEAGPSPAAQQQAAMDTALELAGPEYEEMIKGMDSDITKGAFASLLQASSLEAVESAHTLKDKLNRRDQGEKLAARIQAISLLGPQVDQLNPEMMVGLVKAFAVEINQIKKENSTYNVKEMALDAIESHLNTLSRSYGVESPQMEAMREALDYLADEQGGVLATADNKLDDLIDKAERDIVARENREQDPRTMQKRADLIISRAEQYLIDTQKNKNELTSSDIFNALVQNPDVKKGIGTDYTIQDIKRVSEQFKKKATDPGNDDFQLQLLSDINNGKLKRVLDLVQGKGTEDDRESWNNLDIEDKKRYAESAYAQQRKMYGDDVTRASAYILGQTKIMRSTANTPVAQQYNQQISAIEGDLQATAKSLINDGVPYETVQQSLQQELQYLREKHSNEVVNRANRATTWNTVSQSAEFKDVFSRAEKQLRKIYELKTQDAEVDESIGHSKMLTTILSATKGKVNLAQPELMRSVVNQLNQEGIPLTPDEVTQRLSRQSADMFTRLINTEMRNYGKTLDAEVSKAVAPDLVSFHETDETTLSTDLGAVSAENEALLSVLVEYRGEANLGAQDGKRIKLGADDFSSLVGASVPNTRYRRESIAATKVINVADKARDSLGSLTEQDKQALKLGVYLYGLDARAVREGTLPSGLTLEEVFGTVNWRHSVKPNTILLVSSEEELEAILESSKNLPYKEQLFTNIGYDLGDSNVASKFEKGQRELLEQLKSTPKSAARAMQIRQEFMRW